MESPSPSGTQRPGRRPSIGIDQPASSLRVAENNTILHDDSISNRFHQYDLPNITPNEFGTTMRQAQHDEGHEASNVVPRGGDWDHNNRASTFTPREQQQRRSIPVEQRAPPRHDLVRYLYGPTTATTGRTTSPNNSQSQQRFRHGHRESSDDRRGSSSSMLIGDAASIDSTLFQAAEHLYGPDYYTGRTNPLLGGDEQYSNTSPDDLRFDEEDPSFNSPSNSAPLYQQTPHENNSALVQDDSFLLATLCSEAGTLEMNKDHTEQDYMDHDLSWNEVRRWLEHHSPDDLQLALESRDRMGRTALHFACQNQPPLDIIAHILQLCPSSLEAIDGSGLSPLHCACAHAAAPSVLQLIAETWSPAKIMKTDRGLTPLHLALKGPFRDFSDTIAILASTGAASIPDNEGILPLHYACALGAMDETIRILVASFPEAIWKRSSNGLDPLLFTIANTKTNPKQAPKIVGLLLDLSHAYAPTGIFTETTVDPSFNPVQFLALLVSKIKFTDETKDQCNSIKACLLLLLESGSKPTPTVLSTLRTLPGWLLPTAVLSPQVQRILNEKIKEKFPTVLLISDLYMQLIVLCAFSRGLVVDSVDNRRSLAVYLFVGAFYFQLRELIQIFTLIWFGSFRTFLSGWLLHPSDLLDQVYIVAVICCGFFLSEKGSLTTDEVKLTIMTFSAGLFWAKLFVWMRSIKVDFSVFVSGVFYVTGSVLPYVQGVLIFLIAFSQMFQTIFRYSEDYGCTDIDNRLSVARAYYQNNDTAMATMVDNLQCGYTDDFRPFCNYWTSFLHVLTMFLGELDETEFAASQVGIWIYAFFVFLMNILLSSVLIAIVTNSYKFIQDNEATTVFYTNRLHFLSETDAISNFPCFQRCFSGIGNGFDDWARLTWDNLFSIFAFTSEDSILYGTYWFYRILPALTATVTIPSWFLLGLFTFGALWPPQLREWIFNSRIWKSESKLQEEKNQKERHKKEKQVSIEVAATRDEFYQRLSENRQHYSQIKASMIEKKREIRGEMKRIHVLMGNLFEQAEHLRSEREALRSDSDSESY